MIYFDNSATTRQADEVTDRIADVSRNVFGNPSSLHTAGIEAEKLVTEARECVARFVHAPVRDVVFNSGGTEGDNTVLFGCARARRRERNRIVVSAVEHPAVLEAAAALEREGFEVVRIGVDRACRIDMDALEEAVDKNTSLVSVMAVNNEVGTIMPVREIADIAHRSGAYFHTDAVQALGKIALDAADADFLTMSAHKIHGPKGVGALVAKSGIHLPPLLEGGGQEKGRRSGTENVPGIAGFGTAVRLADEQFQVGTGAMRRVRDRLKRNIVDTIDDALVNSPEDGAVSVLNVSFPGTRGEVLLHTLEQDEIYVSTGSACSSNKKGQSHVLTAMGLKPAEIEGALRFSFSRYNTEEEADIACDRLKQAVDRFRRLGSFR